MSVARLALFLEVLCCSEVISLSPAWVPSARRGTDFCWNDPSFAFSRSQCCVRGARCFEEGRYTDDGKALTADLFGIFTRVKCCHRPANLSSFYGFVNPTGHLADRMPAQSMTAQIMNHFATRLPTDMKAPLWTFLHTDGEVPRQIAWEVSNFQAHEEEFRAVYESKRRAYRVGHHSCSAQIEAFGTAAVNLQEFMEHIAKHLSWGSKAQPRFVNIGANNGIDDDPLASVLQAMPHAWAVAAEMDPELCEQHRANLPHVNLWCGMVTPATAWDMIDGWLPEPDSTLREKQALAVDVLKIDIDSYDCALAETLLQGAPSSRIGAAMRLTPAVILMEVNDAIPPPVQMALLFNPALSNISLESGECAGNIPIAGCSLSYQVHRLGRFGFRLVLYATGNAVFVHESVLPALAGAGIVGPLDEIECYWHTVVAAQCASGRQVRRWSHEIPPWDALSEIWQHLKALEQHFRLPQMPISLSL